MARRTVLLALLAIATGCSQRSPRRVVTPSPSSSSSPEQQAEDLAVGRVALMTRAVPADATVVVGALMVPVAGIERSRLDDTFDDARDGGSRRHGAIDIMAPRGTAVLSAQDGRILRLTRSTKGGITVYATDQREQYVFYYAHLDRYHPGLYAGRQLARGDTLGYVGTTGNAPENAPHLHFQMMRMPADRKYWNGEPINPFPLLRESVSP
jgi:murein DD-endopeptidase MepM/ murein hydrolase activator NlpD